MTKRYWFKAKKYGWGWTPATLEGWLVLAAFILIFIDYLVRIERISNSVSDTLYAIVVPSVVGVSILVFICYLTGESPRWKWGEKKRKIK